MDIGKKVKQLRLERGNTQEQLADAMGVTAQAVSRWESGATMPDIMLLPDLSAFFGVTIDELFELTDEAHMNRIEKMIRSGEELREKDFDYAEGYLKKRTGKRGTHTMLSRLYIHRADEYMEKAKKCAQRALLEEPCNKENHSLLRAAAGGVSWDWILNEHHTLIEYYYDFITKNPDAEFAYVYLAENLISDNRLEEAERICERLKQFDTLHYLRLKGKIAEKRGDSRAAEAAFDELTEKAPDNWKALSYKADHYAAQGRFEEAEELYKKAAAMQSPPRLTDDFIALLNIYDIKGDTVAAAEMCANVADILVNDHGLDPDSTPVMRYRAKAKQK